MPRNKSRRRVVIHRTVNNYTSKPTTMAEVRKRIADSKGTKVVTYDFDFDFLLRNVIQNLFTWIGIFATVRYLVGAF